LTVLTAAFYLLMPALVIYLAHHLAWVRSIGVIIVCYALGMGLGFGGLVPASAAPVPEVLSQLSIVLGLPLLLFSLDVRQWSRVAGKALLSLLFAVGSVACLASALYLLLRDGTDTAANLAAMSVGVYSGGTPNLAAIKTGLDIPNAQYLAFHSLDAVVGSLYFFFMLTLGVPLFRALLPGRGAAGATGGPTAAGQAADEDDYRPLLDPANLRQAAAALLLALLLVLLSMGIARLWASVFGEAGNSAVLIIALTTLAIGCSLHRRVRAFTLSYRLGMYLIYVFCLAVASLVSVEELARLDATLAIFLLSVVFGGLGLHALLCRIAGVDGDTFLVTSVAAVASPPFVPLMARALNNPNAMLAGMTTGVIGYALGSYLGISLGLYLRGL
tara:strand:- start:943 stop:2103 length:1161 start_codon:yes stop_codon:yes gene_type:complete